MGTPYAQSAHCQLTAYIEIETEKVVVLFWKRATCNEFADLIRRQLFDGVFKEHELELFLADDDGNFDDKNEPPPGTPSISQIVDIGLDSFYFRIANNWQLSASEKDNLNAKIKQHKEGLSAYIEPAGDSDDDSDSGTPLPNSNSSEQKRREQAPA